MRPDEPAATERFAAFRHRSFTLYWLARFLSTFSIQIISVAVGWQIYDLTRDPFDLGLIGLVQFLPSLLLILVTGAVADRFGRRMIMGICEIVALFSALALVFLTLRGLTSPLPVFVVLVVFGTARAFFAPASTSLAPNLVPEEDLANAIAWNSMSWQSATILGPVAGGLLYGLGASVPYITSTVLFLCGSILIFTIPRPHQQRGVRNQSWKTLSAGFRYIWREKIVLGAISLDMFAVLLGGAVALMPVFARDILDLGPWGLGLLRAAPGVGAVAMAIYLTAHPFQSRAGHSMLIAVGVFGAATTVFGLSTIAWLSILALAVMGAADMISVYVRQTLIQLWTPDKLRGRVSAVNMVFIGASNELGEFRAGGMAALIGAVPAVALGGIGAIGVAGIWALLFPGLRKIQRLRRVE
ncbi:MFS transporter [Hoeflea prorocentri]|uniref:Multidrug efflux pump Tap n=1 Tax=Hoeflea prorocentri TaxID=1922333 RepID=A0A9X3ZJY9_9HYPH|nr:MFS transporter [Hoeflea prorocentri]MCY6383310.1 MFS transporter [Hoeflea prorocentri]MDA5401110.1 MFS transporter [Hoeflea prorocentri]